MIREATSIFEKSSKNQEPRIEIDPLNDYCKVLSSQGLTGWKRNEEAGDIDGVVSLVNENPYVDEAQVVRAANLVMALLRRKLPHAEFEAFASQQPDNPYLVAYRHMHADQPVSVGLPFTNDYPPLLPCDGCGRTPVVSYVMPPTHQNSREANRPQRLCADCNAREPEAGREHELSEGAVPSISFSLEDHLLELINNKIEEECAGRSRVRAADNFSDLADRQEKGNRRNHLATVFIDGDNIGGLLARLDADNPESQSVVKKLAETTKQALLKATWAVTKDRAYDVLPVIPHVLGGDDVLATVLATEAWAFTRVFLEEFEREAKTRLPSEDQHAKPFQVTASAAIVFAHNNYPFSSQVDVAEEVLSAAKKSGQKSRYLDQGALSTSTIGWVDLTRDKSPYDKAHRQWSIGDLAHTSDHLGELMGAFKLNKREILAQLLMSEDKEAIKNQLHNDAKRHKAHTVLGRYVGGTDEDLADLADLLSMMRWWK
jgi:hypothetical protein